MNCISKTLARCFDTGKSDGFHDVLLNMTAYLSKMRRNEKATVRICGRWPECICRTIVSDLDQASYPAQTMEPLIRIAEISIAMAQKERMTLMEVEQSHRVRVKPDSQ